MDQHPAIARGRAAVITGGCKRHRLRSGQTLCGDGNESLPRGSEGNSLRRSVALVADAAESPDHVMSVATDVGRREDVQRLKDQALAAFGEIALLMNNAGTGGGGSSSATPGNGKPSSTTNLWGVINGTQIFAPAMADQGTPAPLSIRDRSRGSRPRQEIRPTMCPRPV